MTAEVVNTRVTSDESAFRDYEIMERLRAGQSAPEIAESLGVSTQAINLRLKALADYARKNARDAASLAFMVATQRFDEVYQKAHEVATDPLVDVDVRLKAMTLCVQATQKVCDLHQIGRPGSKENSTLILAAEDLSEAEAISAARRIGLTIPTSIEVSPLTP